MPWHVAPEVFAGHRSPPAGGTQLQWCQCLQAVHCLLMPGWTLPWRKQPQPVPGLPCGPVAWLLRMCRLQGGQHQPRCGGSAVGCVLHVQCNMFMRFGACVGWCQCGSVLHTVSSTRGAPWGQRGEPRQFHQVAPRCWLPWGSIEPLPCTEHRAAVGLCCTCGSEPPSHRCKWVAGDQPAPNLQL